MDLNLLRTKFQSSTKIQKSAFLSALTDVQYEQVRFFTDIMLRDNQIVEPGNWRYWLFVGGRGTGKSFTGAAEIRKRVYNKQKGLCIIAATHQELMKTMIPAIEKEFPAHNRPKYKGGDKQVIECHNGITIDCRTSQQGDIRGPNYTFVWIDELVKCWDGIPDKVYEKFRILDASVRKQGSQILITTTGDNWKIFREWYKMFAEGSRRIQIRTGRMNENEYLSPTAVEDLYRIYGNSRYAAQELDGIINFQTDGALWNPDLINNTRINGTIEEVANPSNPNNIKRFNHPYDFFRKFFIGADPATTSNSTSDAWGIVVSGLGKNNHVYVVSDHSKIMSPGDAANLIAALHKEYRNADIIAESNQGGEMISYILRTKIPNVIPKLIHAHQNKMTRAQPVVVLWDQGRAHIVGRMEQLEEEMCNYTGLESEKSPNRLDAMVYACQYALLEANTRPGNPNYMPSFR